MSKYLLGAAAAALMIAGGNVVGSNQALANCNLPNANWTCVPTTEAGDPIQGIIYEPVGGSGKCKTYSAEQATEVTSYAAINPGGNEVASKGGEGDPVVGDPVKTDTNPIGGNSNQPDCPVPFPAGGFVANP